MKLTSAKSAQDVEEEKQKNLIKQSILASTVTSSFSDMKSEKLLNKKLNRKNLGIISKSNSIPAKIPKLTNECEKNDNGNVLLSLVGQYSSSSSDTD